MKRNGLWEYFVKNETFRINEAWDWCENILIVKIHNKRLNKVEACKIVCTCLWFTDQYFISDLKVVVVRSCTKCYIFLCVAFCRNNGLMNWWILYVLWKKKYKKKLEKEDIKDYFLLLFRYMIEDKINERKITIILILISILNVTIEIYFE